MEKPRKLTEGAIGEVHVDDVRVETTRKRPSVRTSEFFGLWKNRKDMDDGLSTCEPFAARRDIKMADQLIKSLPSASESPSAFQSSGRTSFIVSLSKSRNARRQKIVSLLINLQLVQWATAPQPGSGFIEFPGGYSFAEVNSLSAWQLISVDMFSFAATW